MPIYEYRCSSCGHELETLQKFADAPLTECPACKAATLVKLVSAAGFQLKGSGWYATDFRGGSSARRRTGGGYGAPRRRARDAGSGAATKSAAGSDAKATPSAGGCGGGCSCH